MDTKQEAEKQFQAIIKGSKKELEEKMVAVDVLDRLAKLQRSAGQPDTEAETIVRNAKTQLRKFEVEFDKAGV